MYPRQELIAQRPAVTHVVSGQKVGFVSSHIDVGWTFAPASLACQAQIERLLDLLALPAVLNDFALQHFKQQAGAPTCGIALLARRAVARTHESISPQAASPHADTMLYRTTEAALLVNVGEMA